MKKLRQRKAFTIVELSIVIAVIAILAAVLIPVISGAIERANEVNDQSTLANINTILALESVNTGSPNDATEIRKIIKAHGLELKTKSKGSYFWYDIANKRVVLAGLNDDGIALPENEVAAVDGAPIVFALAAAEQEPTTQIGEFKEAKDITSPEGFVEGYLFISESSKDGLADAIYGLRNPANNDEIKNALDKINGYGNDKLSRALNGFMSNTVVITKNGKVLKHGDTLDAGVNRVIVSPDFTTITKDTLDEIAKYENIVVVNLHSGVTDIDKEEAVPAMKDLKKPFFVYSSNEIGNIAKENDVDVLISVEDKNELTQIDIYDVILGEGDEEPTSNLSTDVVVFKGETLEHKFYYYAKEGDASGSYDFVGYSFFEDGSQLIELNSISYTLGDVEKYLIDDEGHIKLYRVFKKATTDFKIGDYYYSSEAAVNIIADVNTPNEEKIWSKTNISGSSVITVVSQTAALDGDKIKIANKNINDGKVELTIPAGAELLLPFHQEDGVYKKEEEKTTESNTAAVSKALETNKEESTYKGKTQLLICNNINLINDGTIYVDAKLYTKSTAVQGSLGIKDGKWNAGVLEIDGTSMITNGAATSKITSYGIIRGAGSIYATDGEVLESMTVLDWYGGTNASYSVVFKKIMPFNNWKADNISLSLIMSGNVDYSAYGTVNVSGDTPVNLKLLSNEKGDNAKDNPLFLMDEEAKIIKTAKKGKLTLAVESGKIEDCEKEIEIASYAGINFKTMALPLPNFNFTVAEGASLTLSHNKYKVLPGSQVTVNGNLTLATTVAIYNEFDMHFVKPANTYTKKYNYGTNNDGSPNYKALSVTGILTGENILNIPTSYGTDFGKATPLLIGETGILTFANGAIFTGEIKSTQAGAKIVVETGAKFENKAKLSKGDTTSNGEAEVHGIREGYYISLVWYDVYINGLHTTAIIAGIDTSQAGEYVYTEGTDELGEIYYWKLLE